jgi:hypothetical protein
MSHIDREATRQGDRLEVSVAAEEVRSLRLPLRGGIACRFCRQDVGAPNRRNGRGYGVSDSILRVLESKQECL